jgi:hypothetical protein
LKERATWEQEKAELQEHIIAMTAKLESLENALKLTEDALTAHVIHAKPLQLNLSSPNHAHHDMRRVSASFVSAFSIGKRSGAPCA